MLCTWSFIVFYRPVIAKTNLVCSRSPSLFLVAFLVSCVDSSCLQTGTVAVTVRMQASLHCHSLLAVQDPELASHVSASCPCQKPMLGLMLFQVSSFEPCLHVARFVGLCATQCQPRVLVLREVHVLHAVHFRQMRSPKQT